MKRYLFFMLVLGIGMAQNGFSQKFNKTDVALCFYLVDIDQNFGAPLNTPYWDSIYVRISKILSDSALVTIKPVGFLKDDVAYSFTGYPLVRGKKAAKSNKAENYMKITVDIGPAGMQTTTSSSIGMGESVSKGKKKTRTKVKVKVGITVYNKQGEEVLDLKESAVSKGEILVESESFSVASFSVTSFKENTTNNEKFQGLLDEAVIKLARAMR